MDAAGKVMLMLDHLEGEKRRLDEADAAAARAAEGGDDGKTPAERDVAKAKRDAAREAVKACAREWAAKFTDFMQRLDAHVSGVPPPVHADKDADKDADKGWQEGQGEGVKDGAVAG